MTDIVTQKQEIFDYVSAMLGGGMIDVELDPQHYEISLRTAFDKFRQRSDNSVEESYIFLDTTIDQNDYTLANEIVEVRKIFRRSIGSRTGGGDGGTLFEPFNLAYTNTYLLASSNMGGLAKVLPITFAFFLASSLASLALPGMSGFISEITVFLGITSQDGFSSLFRSITIIIAAIGLVLTPIYLLSMCRRVFFGPRIPALATVKEMNGRELTIGFSLLLPTLVIGFWPKVAINLYESSTNALSQQLTLAKLVGIFTPLVS